MYFLEPFLENLLPSLLYIIYYLLFIIIEIIFTIIIVVKIKQNKIKVFLKAISIISLSIIIFFLIGIPSSKLDVTKKLNSNNLIGKWDLETIARKGKEKASEYNNYIKLNKNGLCKFNSIDYNSSRFVASGCQWSLQHNIRADNSLYENNVITIVLDSSLEKRYFYFKQQGDEFIIYNYYLNDWYDKVEYKRETE